MLLAFSEQTKGQKLPENLTDQEMMEIVMSRYEKEVMHPLQNLISGELARAMLIQIQKLKLDLETAMLELDQILKANEINFAVLAALPAFFISLILLYLARIWVLQDRQKATWSSQLQGGNILTLLSPTSFSLSLSPFDLPTTSSEKPNMEWLPVGVLAPEIPGTMISLLSESYLQRVFMLDMERLNLSSRGTTPQPFSRGLSSLAASLLNTKDRVIREFTDHSKRSTKSPSERKIAGDRDGNTYSVHPPVFTVA
ncbi:hypothetical protein KSP40_PGU021131 [Platanthera guangdongensis]|uniref:Uncharacterized protein n=1 Tax=Platanthera guangdongensis TaxID=2320717 RepID=A0ABR2N1W7_9ASPA